MRDRIERLVLLPFSMGCVSESSISVGSESISTDDHLHHRSNRRNYSDHNNNSSPPPTKEEEYEEEENLKSFISAPKFQRLFKNFKNISHLFVYKEEDDDDDDDDDDGDGEEMGMEIGFPTDVKHVTHIGIDGSTTSILSKAWDLKHSQFNNNNIHGVSHQIL